ncbi:ABC transporter [Clostridia bacterium]|nr:ABC transporter [Clostridia bacterium]
MIIQVKSLSKTYSAIKAVDNISFDVPRGSLFAFLGQNGAGKSTTINMLLGLIHKDSGEVTYGGSSDFAAYKNNIGAVFQNNIFDELLTVEENLRVFAVLYSDTPAQAKSRLNDAIIEFGLRDFAKQRFGTLSGGQKRKAEIARALLNDPQVLFLDEPTTGLDPKTRAEVWRLIDKVRREKGMTIFLTTHYMEETADADEVVIIHKGKITAIGSPAELKDKYSSDRLLITPKSASKFEKSLQSLGIAAEKIADSYSIFSEDVPQSIELLSRLKDNIKYYEVRRGSMDGVFLNAVGEALEVQS